MSHIGYNENMYCVKRNPYNLRFVPPQMQTLDMCTNAVENCSITIKYVDVKYQTEELCMKAITNDPYAYEYIINKTPEMTDFITKNHSYVFDFIKEKKYGKLNFSFGLIHKPIPNQNEDCMLCFDSNGEWCEIKCGHKYHLSCIAKCITPGQINKCPYCQKNI